LRFPGFKGEWARKKLGDDCNILMCKRIFSEETSEDEEIPFYKIGTLGNLPDAFIKRDLYEEYKNKYRFPRIGEILITCSGTVGKCIQYDGKEAYYQDSNIVWIDNPKLKVINEFLFYVIANINWSKLNSTTIKRIYGSDFRNLALEFPIELKEQKQIAYFLTSIGERLQSLKHKLNLLEQYKKAVIQRIFSLEIRFTDDKGKEYPKWEKKKIVEVATKKSSNISANKIEENFGNYIIYGASGVLKKVDFYEEESDYISIIKDGAGVGRLFYCSGKSSVLGTMEIIKPKPETNTYFLYCLLSNIDFMKYITGSTIPHIYFKDYSVEICGIPNLSEQVKIANFLSALDEKINHTKMQIEKTEQYKKGLLQKMFC